MSEQPITGTEEADALVGLVNHVVDRLEKAEDALEALAGELSRCIDAAPTEEARAAYQWVETYLLRLPGAFFLDRGDGSGE